MFILSYTEALRGPTSGLIQFCSTRLFRMAFLLVEFIAPMFCDIPPTCVCLLSSFFLRFNRSNHSNQPGWAVFTLTPHPFTPAHTSPHPFYTPPTCSPPHPHPHTSSDICVFHSDTLPPCSVLTPPHNPPNSIPSPLHPHTLPPPGSISTYTRLPSSPCPAASLPHSAPCM